jgi:hypothetical protein
VNSRFHLTLCPCSIGGPIAAITNTT